MMWNNSCGDGIRPVSSFDQTGISLKLISNAPDEMSCVGEKRGKEKCNFLIKMIFLVENAIFFREIVVFLETWVFLWKN